MADAACFNDLITPAGKPEIRKSFGEAREGNNFDSSKVSNCISTLCFERGQNACGVIKNDVVVCFQTERRILVRARNAHTTRRHHECKAQAEV